jgi:hypothetical protein
MWKVEVTDQFIEWWPTLSDAQQEAVTDRVDLFAERGPDLGRPVVDRIHSSRHQSMKELRAAKGGALRVLFSFDPRRQAILLLGGDKSGEWNDWYAWAVPLADDLYDEYLRELGEEGLI